MLYVRDILRIGPKRLVRIVGIYANDAVLFDLETPKTLLEVMPFDQLMSSYQRGKIVLETRHPFNRASNIHASEARLARARKFHGIVTELLCEGSSLFDSAARGHLVAKTAKLKGLTATTIHAALYRYWKFGMTLEALLPNFDRIGGKGQERRTGTRPLGRKGPSGAPRAPRITDEIVSAFEKGTNRYYRNNPRNSLAEAYRLICGDLLTECVFDPATGAPTTFIKRATEEVPLPTERQFRFWYQKQERAKADKRARVPEAKYEARHRPKLSFAAQDNENIGGRYIIDSTPLDLNLVSRLSASTFLSTATLYLVTDEFTAFIVGFGLSFEDASWSAASLALLNAVEDKVALCSRFGIEISEEDWPVADLVAMRLIYDRGEAKGPLAENFGLKSLLTIENTAPYRGDLKGIGEQRFDLVNEAARGRVPGYRVKNSGERGEKDPRLDAIFNLHDAICLIIHTIVFLNKNEVPDFRRSRAMIEDGIPPIPLEMWNWARRTGRTALVRRSYEEMLIALLPTAQATITQKGLEFGTLHYTCETAEREKWFEAVTQPARLRKRTISFHPWLVDLIYIHGYGPGEVEVAVLTPHSARYAGLSFEELKELRAEDRGRKRNRQSDQVLNHAVYTNNVKQLVDHAQQRRLYRLRPRDLTGARESRHAEREFDREDHRDTLRGVAVFLARSGARDQQRRLTAPPRLPDDDLGDGPLPSGQ